MAVTVERLGQRHAEGLRGFLGQDPVQNLFLLGLLEEYGLEPAPGATPFELWGASLGGQLRAALFVGGGGGLCVPAGEEADLGAICERHLGRWKLRSAVGEKGAVDLLVRHFGSRRPRLSRIQRLYSVSADDLGPFTNPTLRLAAEAELPALVELAAAAVKETMGSDPLAEGRDAFTARVRQRVLAKRTWVLEVDGRLVFKIDVGSRSTFGAELEGLYTVPDQRHRGHATLSLGQLCRSLLSSLPRLTLRIDDRDEGLATIGRKVGFLPRKAQRLVVD